jgi:hypothetical protein
MSAASSYNPRTNKRVTPILDRSVFEIASGEFQTLPDFFMCEDLAIEDCVDFADPALRAPLEQFFKGLEKQFKTGPPNT